jgi:hypothetical protein
MALFIWAVVYFAELAQHSEAPPKEKQRRLLKCGACVLAACLTRYDGWFLAGALLTLVSVMFLTKKGHAVPGVPNFALLVLAAPLLWFCYNAIIYRNPLEFANGPYSARAIEQKNLSAGVAPHPGASSLVVAGLYFLKSAELNVGPEYLGRIWLLVALAGFVGCFRSRLKQFARRESRAGVVVRAELNPNTLWPLLLLWIPLPFYALSIAYGDVPLFVPVWSPFSLYNVRYGLELLPAFAVFAALIIYFGTVQVRSLNVILAITMAVTLFALTSYALIWKDPLCRREALINSRTRVAIERALAAFLSATPASSTLLMYLGDHAGAVQRAGIPLDHVIHEGNHRPWKIPSDPDGLWERALAHPEKYADYVVAFDGDPVSTTVRKENLKPLALLHISGGPRQGPSATIYQVMRNPD